MKKLSLLFLFGISFCQTKAQNDKEQQQLKNIILGAYESVSQSTRQWLNDATEKHPPGNFDTSYAKIKLKEKLSPAQLSTVEELFACMMAYQKLLAKEAREDQKLKSHMKRLMLADKAEKLKMQNESIDQGMKEAREKADRAMDAAMTELVTGIISGALQIASSATSFSNQVEKDRSGKDSVKIKVGTRAVYPKLSLTQYIRKLEVQLAIVKKEGN